VTGDKKKTSALAHLANASRPEDDDDLPPALDDPDPEGRERRERRWERRREAAKERRHLPDFSELLLGMPFLGEDVSVDIRTWAERVLPLVPKKDEAQFTDIREHVTALTVSANVEVLRDAAAAFRRVDRLRRLDAREAALRLDYYLASLGDRHSPWRIAGEAISRAHDYRTPEDLAHDYAAAAVGWLIHAGRYEPLAAERLARLPPRTQSDFRRTAERFGQDLLERILEERNRQTRRMVENYKKEIGVSPSTSGGDDDANEDPEPEADRRGGPGVVVFKAVGNRDTSERVAREFTKLLNKKLPLARKPDLAAVSDALLGEFPYAAEIISAVLSELIPLEFITLRPMILVGAPGSGKTRFAERLCAQLGLPWEMYPCGGVSDDSIAGTPRRWTSGEPSLPVSLVRRFHHASPAIILDEIEKTGTGRHNGNPLDALLPMLEPLSASHWRDPYLQAAADLSHVIWIGTANSLDGIPAPLRDRCRILHFPEPGPEHLLPLAEHLMTEIVAERGLDPRWALPLDGDELEALRTAWSGGSVRILRRLVEAVLTARDQWRAEEEVQ